jgi:hypothetical protein
MPNNQEAFDYVSNWDNIIKIWAGKASNNYGNYALYKRDYDDVYQELWVKVLEKAKNLEGTNNDLRDEENQPIVTDICKKAIIDMKRYDEIRNSEMTLNMSGSSQDEEDGNIDQALGNLGYRPHKADMPSEAAFHSLMKQFPEGSKERIYLDFYGNMSGTKINYGSRPPVTNKEEGFTRDALAQQLGYAGVSSNGFKSFEAKMDEYIADYFDIDPYEYERYRKRLAK